MSKSIKRSETNIKIGERIRYYRTKANLSQEELAEHIGLTQKHISRIEGGYHNSYFVTILGIAKALNVPIDVFAEDLGDDPNSELINIIISEMKDMSYQQLRMLRDNLNVIKNYNIN